MENNVIQPYVKIGRDTILWSGNHIGHHTTIGNDCFIASHVVVSGSVVVGDETFIGVNATLRDNINIGKRNVIGASALILKDTAMTPFTSGSRRAYSKEKLRAAKDLAHMTWQRHGRIFDPALYRDKVCSHAQVPTVLDCGDRLRIYYADRTPANKSFMCYIDVDAKDPSRILDVHSDSLLRDAAPGTFDDDGAMPACAVRVDGRVFLYYSGWNRASRSISEFDRDCGQ